jgi:hypothetical protein
MRGEGTVAIPSPSVKVVVLTQTKRTERKIVGGIKIRTVTASDHSLQCPTHNAPKHVTDVIEDNSLYRLRRNAGRRLINTARQLRDSKNTAQEWNRWHGSSTLKPKQDEHCTYKRNIVGRSRNHCCRGKPITVTYCDCVSVALITQHAKYMRRIIS